MKREFTPERISVEEILEVIWSWRASARPVLLHGPMVSGKSARAIDLHEYLSVGGDRVRCYSAGTKRRVEIRSRDGRSLPCTPLPSVLSDRTDQQASTPVIVDEAQFVTTDQAIGLAELARSASVLCFGLLWSADGQMFRGSADLIRCGALVVPLPHDLLCHCGQNAVADQLAPDPDVRENRYRSACLAHRPHADQQ